MKALFFKEIRSFLASLQGYIFMGAFLASCAVVLWLLPQTRIQDSGYASLDAFFNYAPQLFLVLIPAITMRSISEERKSGTLEILMTLPLRRWEVVMAKYSAAMALTALALVPTLTYVYTIYELADPRGNIDAGGIAGSYLGLLFLASAYCAVGLFASSVTDNPLVALVLAVAMCVVFSFGFEALAAAAGLQKVAYYLLKFSLVEHYMSMSRGVVDSRDLIYFAGFVVFFLVLTMHRLPGR
ncbi:MAG: ABC transporter permease subunit [Flavobacteriales bacterium]|nr:ABC transporter permease subunit [Flavobacteriales bacterium]MCX7768010.1 ABC transporter permease subunit [Flavobacteriales bacterium]MDW8409215.1 ABC transporter permease subunit [Flavobacteriales bacterium]